MSVNALRLSLKIGDLIREGYSQDLIFEDEGEWMKDTRIEANDGYFCVSIACVSRGTVSFD
jgi:rRNA pseudouridine-1189 N-methylase Emg1 (Nep1/Mra1 family)